MPGGRLQDPQDRIDRKRDELGVKAAEHDAEAAEEDAVDAPDFAWWAVKHAGLTVLDAIDARAWVDERAAASGAR
ncbi:MAG TPA: hypothetical protein VF060_31195 [Trebonia sp.]